ncbi:MAG: sialate O-acetylesterase, partial [archaeon]|nr:sialate O-acetylesterase [archaeon]
MERGPDPNFYIFLCFGQSNMEGQGPIEEEDKEVDERFQMMAAIDFPMFGREKGKWYKAVPPLCREDTKLSLVDYFGRYLTDILPKDIKIGIINVSVGGCKIEMYDENKVENYLKTAPGWLKDNALKYENNPFRVLMNRAKEAQKVGIIKGI